MTTSGTIADPAPAPAKAPSGRFGGARGKNDAGATAGESAGEFGEVMSTLQGQEKPDTAKGLPAGTAHIRRDAIKSERVADEEAGNARDAKAADIDFCSEIDALVSPDDAPAAVQQPDDAATVAPAAVDASAIKDLAALVATIPTQPPAASAPDTAKQQPTAVATDPAAKTRAILDAMTAAADEPPAPPESAPKAPADEAAVEMLPTSTSAPALASQNAPAIPAAKDKRIEPQGGQDLVPGDTSQEMVAVARPDEKPRAPDTPKASVMRQETHFAPVARAVPTQSGASAGEGPQQHKPGAEAPIGEAAPASSAEVQLPATQGAFSAPTPPADQIADHIVQAASTSAFADRLGAASDTPGAKSPVKVLSIQLQPVDLGTVTVRMELKGGELTVHVEADRADTAELIRGDQDTLSNLLRGAGYSVDAGSIKIMEGDRSLVTAPAGQQGAQTSLQSSPQSHSGASERQGHGNRGGGGAPNGGQSGAPASRNEIDGTATNRTGRGLYI
jgi:chemotaxis protein MotD